jgi:hypothetical protein
VYPDIFSKASRADPRKIAPVLDWCCKDHWMGARPERLTAHSNTDFGSVEKGKYADMTAVSGDPLKDFTELQRVKFVMKGGKVARNDLDADKALLSRGDK